MKASRWLRAASVLIALFFLGHTAAVLIPTKSSGPREDAAVQAMRDFRLEVLGSNRSLWDFWQGMNFLLSANLLILAVLSWQIARRAQEDAAGIRPLVASLSGGLVVILVFCWKYFDVPAAGLSSLAAVCMFRALVSLPRRGEA